MHELYGLTLLPLLLCPRLALPVISSPKLRIFHTNFYGISLD